MRRKERGRKECRGRRKEEIVGEGGGVCVHYVDNNPLFWTRCIYRVMSMDRGGGDTLQMGKIRGLD